MAVLQHCRQIVTSTFCERARRCFQNAYFHKTITFEKYFKKQLGKKKKKSLVVDLDVPFCKIRQPIRKLDRKVTSSPIWLVSSVGSNVLVFLVLPSLR